MRYLILNLILIMASLHVGAVEPPVILPKPQECNLTGGFLALFKTKGIRYHQDANLAPESYRLQIEKEGVHVFSSDQNGRIYAEQTLKQLQWQYQKQGFIPCLSILDAPKMKWRSFMLDSGRQYQSLKTIKKYLDMMSLLKMNRFHWHLTEGLGWRIEIKKYPKLTQIGAYVAKGKEQQGYYSQKAIREIVKYAKARGITVIPEIDMPGHAEAALNAYPEFSCFNKKPEIPKEGFTQHIFCAGKDETLAFLKNILDEVCELFPSQYIHLGGDEALKGDWDKCPTCQKRIEDHGLKNSHDLQIWFSAEMAKYLKSKGRKAIFWGDVIYQDGYQLPDNVAIQWWNWRGHQDLAYKNAIKRGHELIAATNYYTYLNFPTSPWKGYQKYRIFDLKDVYENNPSNLQDPHPMVLGMSTSLWTDYGLTEDLLDQRIFPRIFALAQQMWYKGDEVPYAHFYEQIIRIKPLFENQGYQFGPFLKTNP
ncbi:beta-N-acetylhexosaminidase [Sphingobacterium kyonggiense]